MADTPEPLTASQLLAIALGTAGPADPPPAPVTTAARPEHPADDDDPLPSDPAAR